MDPVLPLGAKGIRGDDFAIAFGGDKIVFTLKPRLEEGLDPNEEEKHYTFQAGRKSGVIDLHETRSFPNSRKEHRTLFAMRADYLPPALQQLASMAPELIVMIRPLRIGWMRHRNIGVARGIDLVRDQDVAAVTRKRKQKLSVDPQLYEQNVFVPEFLEEIYDFPDGNFALFHKNRNIGIGFKTTDTGNVRLFWIKRRDLLRFGGHWQGKVIDALRSIAIPPEDYRLHPFLSPCG